jgi:MerR family transcriptional regulator/heat shock protein HspR
MDGPRYTISVAAELTGMHPQTLRVYEARGLVRPRRTPGGTRRYSDRDLERLRLIGRLTGEFGLNLAGAEMVLGLQGTISELVARVAQLEAELDAQAARLRTEVDQVHRSYRRDLVPYEPPTTAVRPWTSRS